MVFLFPLNAAAAEPPPVWTAVPDPWKRELGSHRLIVELPEAPANAVRIHADWRRRDLNPERKAVLVQALESGEMLTDTAVPRCDAEAGDIVFRPLADERRYAVYFLPVKIEGGAFPVGAYTPPPDTASADWKAAADLADGSWQKLPAARVTAWQAISAHEAWNEMEIIATAAETQTLARTAHPFLARLESREHPVRMFDRLPLRWVQEPGVKEFAAQPHEYLVFQAVVWRAGSEMKDVSLEFSGLTGPDGTVIPPENFTCFQTGGFDWRGRAMTKQIDVPAGRVQPLWCGLDLPRGAAPGIYRGQIQVKNAAGEQVILPLSVQVAGDVLTDRGDETPERLSKLRWLNSRLAQDDEVTLHYQPLAVSGQMIECLGREVELGNGGFPQRVTSRFDRSNTAIKPDAALQLLTSPVVFVIEDETGREIPLQPQALEFTRQSPASVDWRSGFTGEGVTLAVLGHMEFDGSLTFQVTVSGDRAVKDIRLVTPRTPETTRYSTGLGQAGGLAPERLDWKWDTASKHQDSLWLGAVNGGMRVLYKAENHVRAAVNIHYKRRPLAEPPSWANGGRGGIRYENHTLTAYSGARRLQPEQPLHFDFELLVTPFHTLQTKEQFTERYYHTGQIPKDEAGYLDKAKLAGANTINIHQGNRLNPYINYPFLTAPQLSAFTGLAHERGQRVKFYYTIRELSNRAPELFALRSLGDEILASGKGGGHPWPEEHLAGDYWQAWFEPGVQDVSLLTATLSRWNNFYIEGLRWLVENAGCDGIYLDDISYDRVTMLRARRVLDRTVPRGGRIDLHSWNELNEAAGYANCVNVFMDSLPFVDRMWFGEGHEYEGPPPEHFLVELSGIPFGLMGEMLEHGGNVWLGLTFGQTARLGWGGEPRAVWKLWDDFGAADARFTGWWDESGPVKSGDPQVKASVWTKPGSVMISLGNFSKSASAPPVLEIDWQTLGLNPDRVHWFSPGMSGMQGAAVFQDGRLPPIPGYSGRVLILSETPPVIETPVDVMAGPVLLEETFQNAGLPGWTGTFSKKLPAAPFKADAGLAFTVPANVHAFIERPLPAGAAAVSAGIWQDPQDAAQQWGPGLALRWPDGSTLKVNRRQDRRFSIAVNGEESLAGLISESAPVEITVAWDAKQVRVFAGGAGMGGIGQELAAIPRERFPASAPDRLRLGKMSSGAGASDHDQTGAPGFSRVEKLTVRGPVVTKPAADQPAN